MHRHSRLPTCSIGRGEELSLQTQAHPGMGTSLSAHLVSLAAAPPQGELALVVVVEVVWPYTGECVLLACSQVVGGRR